MLSGMPMSPTRFRSNVSSGRPSVGRIVLENDESTDCCAEAWVKDENGATSAAESTVTVASERNAARRDRRIPRMFPMFTGSKLLLHLASNEIVSTGLLRLEDQHAITELRPNSDKRQTSKPLRIRWAKHRWPVSPPPPRLTVDFRGSASMSLSVSRNRSRATTNRESPRF